MRVFRICPMKSILSRQLWYLDLRFTTCALIINDSNHHSWCKSDHSVPITYLVKVCNKYVYSTSYFSLSNHHAMKLYREIWNSAYTPWTFTCEITRRCNQLYIPAAITLNGKRLWNPLERRDGLQESPGKYFTCEIKGISI
jgi:hypothetical protein